MSNHVQNDQGKRLKGTSPYNSSFVSLSREELYIKNGMGVVIHSSDPKMIPTMICQCGEIWKEK